MRHGEAGLIGTLTGNHGIGSYHQSRQIAADREMPCHVSVFLLPVDHQADEWPEKPRRKFRWMNPIELAHTVQEGGLAAILYGAFSPIEQAEAKHARRRCPPC